VTDTSPSTSPKASVVLPRASAPSTTCEGHRAAGSTTESAAPISEQTPPVSIVDQARGAPPAVGVSTGSRRRVRTRRLLHRASSIGENASHDAEPEGRVEGREVGGLEGLPGPWSSRDGMVATGLRRNLSRSAGRPGRRSRGRTWAVSGSRRPCDGEQRLEGSGPRRARLRNVARPPGRLGRCRLDRAKSLLAGRPGGTSLKA
jgi:hypothetical protein